ncbi:hypothetical protein [Thalassospira sp. UBA1131]|uniref:hypothetical protein n=1 Tax=Thalassospira sp. UBA1131 TaxID=1947672 RepID=UPI0025F2B95A|nr:hypothetical protein [Thalassospira sp. UBA1131]
MTKSTPLCPNQALLDIELERARQQLVEGWTPEHDDTHDDGEMARAASVYALLGGWPDGPERSVMDSFGSSGVPYTDRANWPWHVDWLKPTDRRRDLVKAGALIVAEIERLDRKAAKAKEAEEAQ